MGYMPPWTRRVKMKWRYRNESHRWDGGCDGGGFASATLIFDFRRRQPWMGLCCFCVALKVVATRCLTQRVKFKDMSALDSLSKGWRAVRRVPPGPWRERRAQQCGPGCLRVFRVVPSLRRARHEQSRLLQDDDTTAVHRSEAESLGQGYINLRGLHRG
jgi:hypothetical protein